MNKKPVNIVWFKRDLRFTDNEALSHAHQSGMPLLLVYFFEPSVMNYDDADTRHWRFIYESIQDLQKKLNASNTKIYFFHNEVETIFSELLQHFDIQTVFSHQEIGNKITYDRDIAMQVFLQKNNIVWEEFQMHGVIRKLKSRQNWDKRWETVMRATPKIIKESDLNLISLDTDLYEAIKGEPLPNEITTPTKISSKVEKIWLGVI